MSALTDLIYACENSYEEPGLSRLGTDAKAELATLRKELEQWKSAVLDALAVACGDCPIGTPPAKIMQQVLELDRSAFEHLHSEKLEEAKKDAARYRWLKAVEGLSLDSVMGLGKWKQSDGREYVPSHRLTANRVSYSPRPSLDMVVDEAMENVK